MDVNPGRGDGLYHNPLPLFGPLRINMQLSLIFSNSYYQKLVITKSYEPAMNRQEQYFAADNVPKRG